MCGRLYNTLSPEFVLKVFKPANQTTVEDADKIYPSYNAAPTRFMAVGKQGIDVKIEAMKWGMLLPNSTDIVINGRIEELR
jgi:hypothetical protein